MLSSNVTVRTNNQPMSFITKICYFHYKLPCKSTLVSSYRIKKAVKIGKHTRSRFRVRLERTCKSMEKQHFSEVFLVCLEFLMFIYFTKSLFI